MNLENKIYVGVNLKIILVTVGMVVGGKKSCNLLRRPISFASIIWCSLYAGWLHLMLIDFNIESTRIKTEPDASTKRKIFNNPEVKFDAGANLNQF